MIETLKVHILFRALDPTTAYPSPNTPRTISLYYSLVVDSDWCNYLWSYSKYFRRSKLGYDTDTTAHYIAPVCAAECLPVNVYSPVDRGRAGDYRSLIRDRVSYVYYT